MSPFTPPILTLIWVLGMSVPTVMGGQTSIALPTLQDEAAHVDKTEKIGDLRRNARTPCKNIAGVCINTNDEVCTEFTVAGHCPGGEEIKCCPKPGEFRQKGNGDEDYPCLNGKSGTCESPPNPHPIYSLLYAHNCLSSTF